MDKIELALGHTVSAQKPFSVKIFTTITKYDYQEPWKAPTRQNYFGSGFIIENERIITNAHLVAGATYIEVQVANDAEKYKADIYQVNHDCDLAMLKIKSRKFWKKVSAVSIGETALVTEKIEVHGFPVGGQGLCITKGTVSRSENYVYTHSQQKLLTTQVSAPINPGSSGAAVIRKRDSKVVGVVHQGLRDAQNTAYIIPASVLKHFIYQVDYGVMGFPDLKITTQSMENAWLRDHFGMTKEQSGLRVVEVPELSSASEYLREDDIILEVDGIKINNNGTANLDGLGNVDWTVLISRRHMDEMVVFTILRERKVYREKVVLTTELRDLSLVTPFEFDKPPTYLFVGGVICLQPITKNLLRDAQRTCAEGTKKLYDQQLVIINAILKSDYSLGYDGLEWEIVHSVNGLVVHNIQDVVDAIEQGDKYEHIIETITRKVIVVPKLSIEEICYLLSSYGILHDRSEDLVSQHVDTSLDIFDCDRRSLTFFPNFRDTPRPGTPIPNLNRRLSDELSSLELSSSSNTSELSSIESLEEIKSEQFKALRPS